MNGDPAVFALVAVFLLLPQSSSGVRVRLAAFLALKQD